MESKYSFRSEWYNNMIEHPTDYYIDPFRIAGNLYFVGTKDSASHLIHTEEGLILIDTGYPNMGAHLLHAIWKCGFKPEDIRFILHTHGHFDHIGNTAFLKKVSGAITLMGKEDALIMKDKPELVLSYYFGGVRTEIFEPDQMIEDGMKICLGSTEIKAIHTPGHTPGTYTFQFAVREAEREYTALLCGGTGFNTLNRVFMSKYGVNYRDDFIKSINIWKRLRADIYLGNHTPQSHVMEKLIKKEVSREQNPFISPEEWGEYIQLLEKRFYEMLIEEG